MFLVHFKTSQIVFNKANALVNWPGVMSRNARDYLVILAQGRSPATMGVGRGHGGIAPLDFEIVSKKWLFFSISRGKKQISPLLDLPWKKSYNHSRSFPRKRD